MSGRNKRPRTEAGGLPQTVSCVDFNVGMTCANCVLNTNIVQLVVGGGRSALD